MTAPRPPLETQTVEVGGRMWHIRSAPSQDTLLEVADLLEHFPFGFLLWESAVGMARFLAARPELSAGQRVLELGAGVGLPGLVAASLGAKVWQTDHQPGTLELSRINAGLNGVEGVQTFLADWIDWRHLDRYDLILGADILYDRSVRFHLEQIFLQCLTPNGSLLLADPGRPQALEFVSYLEKRAWHVTLTTEIVLQLVEEPPQRVDIGLYQIRRKR